MLTSFQSIGLVPCINIIMPKGTKPRASVFQQVSFALSAFIGLAFVFRNALRMRQYHREFSAMMASLHQFRNNFSQIERIRDGKVKEMAFLETVFPTFKTAYFQNIQNPSKYSTKRAKFYEDLEFQQNFEAVLREKGKQYPILFEMKSPSVGCQLAENAVQLDQSGIRFHRNQMISAYGELSYSKEKKRYVMKARLIGVDSIEIQKFGELRLVATIISTFYFSILLGISVSLWVNFQLFDAQGQSGIQGELSV